MSLEKEGRRGEIDRWTDALDWYLILREANRDALTQAVGRRWRQWYSDRENRQVFEHLSALLAARSLYRVRQSCRRPSSAEDTYDPSVTIVEWRRQRELDHASRRHLFFGRRGRLTGRLVATAFAALLLTWSAKHEFRGGSGDATFYETGPAHQREVNLADGSQVLLEQNTALSIALSSSRRAVTLIKGRAWFSVVPAPGRPFFVFAGDETISDVGTSFLVARDPHRLVVAVTKGKVEVAVPAPAWRRLGGMLGLSAEPARAKVLLTRGEGVAFQKSRISGDITWTAAGVPREHAGCRCTPLTFYDESLRTVVATVQRYSSRKILLDPSVASLRLSGLVFRDELDEWLSGLSYILPITVDERGGPVVIRMRHAAIHASKRPHRAAR